jgi:hypothetical protein
VLDVLVSIGLTHNLQWGEAMEGRSRETYRRTTEMEHSRTITLLDMVALLDSDLTGADFVHADADKAHEADVWVVCFHEDDGWNHHC